MTSSTATIDANTLELTVELNKEDLASYVKESETAFGNDLDIPGFRKGNAPRDVIRKHVGESRILETALQTAMQRSLGNIIGEKELDVIEASDLNVKENSADKLIYTVKLKLFPPMKLPALEKIKIARKPVIVDPKEIDETLETVRASRAVLTDSAVPAITGDRVEVDFEVRDNGTVIEGGVSKNHPLTIGDNKFIPGFEDQLVGMKKQDTKEFSLTVPPDFVNKDIAGKKLDFSVTMQDIKNVSLPELNDAFAKSIGKFENIDQLIMNIKDGLTQEKEEKEHQRLQLEIINAIVARADCTAPPAMIEDQLVTMLANFDQDLHNHDMELGLYLAKLGKTQDDLKKEWRPEAERQVKMAIVLHTIIRERKIAVTSEEVNEALQAIMQSAVLRDSGADPANLDLDRMRANIESKLLNEKALEFLELTCTA